MVRLIDADALIEECNNVIEEVGAGEVKEDYYDGYEAGVENIRDYAEHMPTIDAEPQWIPCIERLPDYCEPVITWDGHCYSVEKRIPYIRDEHGKPIKAEWWVSDDYDEEETDYYPNLRDGAAIAWMPLPKPYEVDEE